MRGYYSAEEIKNTIPYVLSLNKNIDAICYAAAVQLEKQRAKLTYINLYAHVYDLDEQTLDALAESLGLGWYDYGYTLEQKRELLKKAGAIKRREGTHWAVLTVLKILYGNDIYIKYWYEDTMHLTEFGLFKLLCDPKNADIDLEKAREAIERVRRAGTGLSHIAPTAVYDGKYCFDAYLNFNCEI